MDRSQTYALYNGRKKVYIGETSDLKKCEEEHRNDGKTFTRIVATSRKVSKETAQKKEQEQLKRYRYGHKGQNPQYNEIELQEKK